MPVLPAVSPAAGWGEWEHPVFAKIVTLTPLTPLSHEGRGGKIKNSPLSPCGRGVGGEGDYKNGMLPEGIFKQPLRQFITMPAASQ
jgi:hypothetical protein